MTKDNYSKLVDTMVRDMAANLTHQMDDALIEGLKRKGFTFESRGHLSKFVMERCQCEEREGEKTYFVDDTPFLLFIPDASFGINHSVDEKENPTFSASIGRFAFL